MTTPQLAVLVAALATMNAPAAASALAQNVPTTRAIGGVVLDSLTGKPLPGVRLFVQRADTPAALPPAAQTNAQGRFRIVAAPTSAFLLCADLSHLRATRFAVAAGSDSVAPEIRILTYRSHKAALPSAGLTAEDQRAIWAALLVALGAPPEPGCVPEPHYSRSSLYYPPDLDSEPVVLDLDSLAPGAMRDTAWQWQLIRDGVVVAVCQHAHLDACGQRGFRMYYELGSPTLYAPDSVSVHVDYLSEAVDLCRIHRAVLNAGGEDFILFKVGGKWLYGDADAASVMDVGFGSCGPSDTLAYPRRRQPN